MRHVISVLLQNEVGALTRMTGLFSSRGVHADPFYSDVNVNDSPPWRVAKNENLRVNLGLDLPGLTARYALADEKRAV